MDTKLTLTRESIPQAARQGMLPVLLVLTEAACMAMERVKGIPDNPVDELVRVLSGGCGMDPLKKATLEVCGELGLPEACQVPVYTMACQKVSTPGLLELLRGPTGLGRTTTTPTDWPCEPSECADPNHDKNHRLLSCLIERMVEDMLRPPSQYQNPDKLFAQAVADAGLPPQSLDPYLCLMAMPKAQERWLRIVEKRVSEFIREQERLIPRTTEERKAVWNQAHRNVNLIKIPDYNEEVYLNLARGRRPTGDEMGEVEELAVGAA